MQPFKPTFPGVFLCIILSISGTALKAQSPNQLIEMGDKHLALNELDSAYKAFERAADLYWSASDTSAFFDTKLKAGIALRRMYDYKKLKVLVQSLFGQFESWNTGTREQKARAYRALGAVEEFGTGRTGEAVKYYRKAIGLYTENDREAPDYVVTQLYIDLGIAHQYIGGLDSAEYYFRLGKQLSEKHFAENKFLLAAYEHNIALNYKRKNELQAASAVMKQASAILTPDTLPRSLAKVADFYIQHSDIYLQLGYYDSALYMCHLSQEKLEASKYDLNAPEYGQLNYQFAKYYETTGQLEMATKTLKKAIKIDQLNYGPNDSYALIKSIRLAMLMMEAGDSFEEAKGYLELAKRNYERMYGPNDPRTAYVLRNLGSLYLYDHEVELAQEHLLQALRIQQGTGNALNSAIVKVDLANAYIASGDYPKAIELLSDCLEVFTEVYGKEHSSVAETYATLGETYTNAGKVSSALLQLEQSRAIIAKVFDQHHPLMAQNHLLQAKAYETQGDLEQALHHTDQAIASNSIHHDHTETYVSNKTALEAINLKTHLLKKQMGSQISLGRLEAIKKVYDEGLTLIMDIARQGKSSKGTVSVMALHRTLFDGAIDNLYEMMQIDKDNVELKYDFLNLTENSRATVLALNKQMRDLQKVSEVPDSLIRYEQQLLDEMASVEAIIHSGKFEKTATADEYLARLYVLRDEYAQLVNVFRRHFQKYHQLKFDQISQNPSGWKNGNDAGTSLAYYLTKKHLYFIVPGKTTPVIRQVNKPTDLNEEIARFNEALKNRSGKEFSTSANALYKYLITPVADLIKGEDLSIVPDGNLWNLQFDLLKQSSNPDLMDFLIKDHAVSINLRLQFQKSITSLGRNEKLLAFSYNEPKKEEPGGLIVFRNEALASLPGTAEEVKAISPLFKGEYLFGDSATESNFKRKANQYSMIHLAIHGTVDYENSELSSLFFRSKTDSMEDGQLYPYELYGMKLDADLVVLSGCETGTGQVITGEGIMSLGRAFRYAGAGSLLLSRWDVSDEVAPRLMESFYTHLKEGKNKAQALRLAKLDYLKTADNLQRDPFFWGNFYILGDVSPIGKKYSYQKLLYLLLTLTLVLGTWMMIKRRKAASLS